MNFRLLFLFFFLPSAVSAQFLSYQILSTKNGLVSNEMHVVMQDSKGYIWIGTKNGLFRWDSKNFESFTIEDGLPNNEVLHLCEGSEGRIWISTFSQKLCYFLNGHIYNERNTPFLNKINNRPGGHLIEQNNELYYASSIDAKLYKFNLVTHKSTIINDSLVLPSFYFIMHKGKVCVIQDRQNIKLNINGNAKNLILATDTCYYTSQYLFTEFPNNDIITLIDFKNKKYYFQHGFDAPFYQAGYTDSDFLLALYNKGRIVEVYNDFIKHKKTGYVMKVDNPTNRPQIILIKENLFMIVAGGLLFCRQVPILEYEQAPKINNGARFVFKYNNETYIVNDKYQLVNVSQQKKVNQFKSNAINLYNLLKFENRFYVTTSFDIYRFEDPNKKIEDSENINLDNSRYFNQNFKYISPSKKKGYFFVANGIRVGLLLVNFQERITIPLLFDTLKSIYSVCEDSKMRLWYSTADKVYYTGNYYNGIKNSREFVLDASHPLFCKSICEDDKGNLFFTTNGGIFVYDGKKKYRIDQSNLLTDNECNKLIIDTVRRSFWVATKNGLSQIGYAKEGNSLKFKVLSKFFASDGLRSDNINDLLLDSNKLYIATDKGVNILDDVGYRPDTMRIPVYIKLNAINAVVNKGYDTIGSISLQHDQNNLSIGFSALYFLRRDRLKVKAYLYRNGNLVSQSEITGDKIDYYSLNDGDYRLVLYAFDPDYTYINGRSVPFLFTINPPYYKTWWFIIGSSLLVIVVSTSLLLWNLNRRKKRAIRQAELQAKLNESTLKSLQSQMNPHFVFNSLNTIQSFITEKNEEGAIDYLSDFSGLMREILEQSVHTFISLENEIQFLKQYIQLEITRYKYSFDVAWDIALEEDDLTDIYIPTMLIQPILENAVKHGVSGLNEKKGHIKISFGLEDENLLKVVVRDNGKAAAEHNKFKGNSIAVKTIRERLNIYTKNRIKGEYNLQVSETGATATITIPI